MSPGSSRRLPNLTPDRTDEAFDLLRDERRRAVVRALGAVDGAVPVRDLATDLSRSSDPSAPDTDRVVIDLHHCVLPKFDRLGIVAYDAAERVVEPRNGLDDLLGILEYVDRRTAQQ